MVSRLRTAFDQQGFLGPFDAFSLEEIGPLQVAIERALSRTGGRPPESRNRHLDWPIAQRLCSNASIISTASELLGANLILWRSNFFVQPKGWGLPWHRDEYRTLLSDPSRQVSVHLAITCSTEDNCVSLIPGTHLMQDAELVERGFRMIKGTDRDTYGASNYLRTSLCRSRPVQMILRAGQYFVFHPFLLHGSFDLAAVSLDLGGAWTAVGRLRRRLTRVLWFRQAARLALGMRITVPGVKVFSAAFRETLPRDDKCVLLLGRDDARLNELWHWTRERPPK